MKSEIPSKLLLKPSEAARLLGISERKLWQMTQDGEIQSILLGRCRRYSLRWLEDWIAAGQSAHHAPTAPGDVAHPP